MCKINIGHRICLLKLIPVKQYRIENYIIMATSCYSIIILKLYVILFRSFQDCLFQKNICIKCSIKQYHKTFKAASIKKCIIKITQVGYMHQLHAICWRQTGFDWQEKKAQKNAFYKAVSQQVHMILFSKKGSNKYFQHLC